MYLIILFLISNYHLLLLFSIFAVTTDYYDYEYYDNTVVGQDRRSVSEACSSQGGRWSLDDALYHKLGSMLILTLMSRSWSC